MAGMPLIPVLFLNGLLSSCFRGVCALVNRMCWRSVRVALRGALMQSCCVKVGLIASRLQIKCRASSTDEGRAYGVALRAYVSIEGGRNAAWTNAGFSLAERYGYAVSDGPQPRAVKAADPRQQAGFQLRKLWLTLNTRGKVTRAPYWRRFDRSGYVDIAEGLGGVMVQPEFFDDAAFAIPPILWTVDDIWLSGTLARRGIPIWVDCRLRKIRTMIDVSLTDPLYKLVVEGVGRLEADRACIEHMRRTYGIWGGVAAQST